MTNTHTTSDWASPVGATSVDTGDESGRLFYGATSVTLREDVTVATGGFQTADGAYEWEVWAGPIHPDVPLTAAQARQIGEALIAAADELEQLGAVAR